MQYKIQDLTLFMLTQGKALRRLLADPPGQSVWSGALKWRGHCATLSLFASPW